MYFVSFWWLYQYLTHVKSIFILNIGLYSSSRREYYFSFYPYPLILLASAEYN